MSTTPSKVITQFVNEGSGYEYVWSYGSSLVGETVSWVVRATGATGTGTVLATAAGGAANATANVSVNYGSLATGVYDLEVYKAFGATGEFLLYPPENVNYRVIVQERFGV